MRILRTAAAVALVLVAAGLVACGGGDDPAPASSGSGPCGLDAKTKQAMLNFARCMREHGINMPDPKFSSNGATVMQNGGAAPPLRVPFDITATRGCTACTSTGAPDRSSPWCVTR